MNEQTEEIKLEMHELIRHLLRIEDNIIEPIDVQEATITGKRGIFSEPSHKELTIKVKFIEDSQYLSEKRAQLCELESSLEADIERIRAEIAQIDKKESE